MKYQLLVLTLLCTNIIHKSNFASNNDLQSALEKLKGEESGDNKGGLAYLSVKLKELKQSLKTLSNKIQNKDPEEVVLPEGETQEIAQELEATSFDKLLNQLSEEKYDTTLHELIKKVESQASDKKDKSVIDRIKALKSVDELLTDYLPLRAQFSRLLALNIIDADLYKKIKDKQEELSKLQNLTDKDKEIIERLTGVNLGLIQSKQKSEATTTNVTIENLKSQDPEKLSFSTESITNKNNELLNEKENKLKEIVKSLDDKIKNLTNEINSKTDSLDDIQKEVDEYKFIMATIFSTLATFPEIYKMKPLLAEYMLLGKGIPQSIQDFFTIELVQIWDEFINSLAISKEYQESLKLFRSILKRTVLGPAESESDDELKEKIKNSPLFFKVLFVEIISPIFEPLINADPQSIIQMKDEYINKGNQIIATRLRKIDKQNFPLNELLAQKYEKAKIEKETREKNSTIEKYIAIIDDKIKKNTIIINFLTSEAKKITQNNNGPQKSAHYHITRSAIIFFIKALLEYTGSIRQLNDDRITKIPEDLTKHIQELKELLNLNESVLGQAVTILIEAFNAALIRSDEQTKLEFTEKIDLLLNKETKISHDQSFIMAVIRETTMLFDKIDWNILLDSNQDNQDKRQAIHNQDKNLHRLLNKELEEHARGYIVAHEAARLNLTGNRLNRFIQLYGQLPNAHKQFYEALINYQQSDKETEQSFTLFTISTEEGNTINRLASNELARYFSLPEWNLINTSLKIDSDHLKRLSTIHLSRIEQSTSYYLLLLQKLQEDHTKEKIQIRQIRQNDVGFNNWAIENIISGLSSIKKSITDVITQNKKENPLKSLLKGNIEEALEITERNPDIEYVDPETGGNLLHIIMSYGNMHHDQVDTCIEMMQILINKGINIHHINNDNLTPLAFGLKHYMHKRLFIPLNENGAWESKNKSNQNILHMLARENLISEYIPDSDYANNQYYYIQNRIASGLKIMTKDQILTLLKTQDTAGNTPLHLAAYNDLRSLQILLTLIGIRLYKDESIKEKVKDQLNKLMNIKNSNNQTSFDILSANDKTVINKAIDELSQGGEPSNLAPGHSLITRTHFHMIKKNK